LPVSDVFREVDEEVRRDQFLNLWKAYGTYAAAAVALIVLLFGGYMFWQDQRKQQAEATGLMFAKALALAQSGKSADAAGAFAGLAGEARAGYRALALLQEAAARLNNKDADGAVAAYERLAADSGVDAVWRDLGRLMTVLHRFESAPPAELESRLAPLLADTNTWRFTARELTAVLRLRSGDIAAARDGFRRLADDTAAPPGSRARAAELLAAIGEGN
jgi:hypothetical protein